MEVEAPGEEEEIVETEVEAPLMPSAEEGAKGG